ncbi:MAG: hypothetical protein ACYTDT_11855 [Planctomycetota bacterium]|jgi:hypothetical protein
MDAPQEIRKLFEGVDITAYARLSSGLTSAIGETHLLVVLGKLHVFARDSIMGEFDQPELDSSVVPALTAGTFNDVLGLTLADGTAAELNVSSFDHDTVVKLLDCLGAPSDDSGPPPTDSEVQSAEAPPVEEPGPPEEPLRIDAHQPEAEAPPLIPESPFENTKDDSGLIDLSKLNMELSQPAESPSEVRTETAVQSKPESNDADEKDVKPDKDGVISYKSSDPGCFGCLLQLVLFFGSISAFWMLHPVALQNLWAKAGWGTPADSGFFWGFTKLLAVIAGGYLGGRLSGLVTRFAEFRMLGGAVIFKGRSMIVFGPKGRTTHNFDLSRPITWACNWHSGDDADDENRSLNVLIRITQGAKIAVLKARVKDKTPNFHVKNMNYSQSGKPLQDDDAVNLDDRRLRQVIRRIAQAVGWE